MYEKIHAGIRVEGYHRVRRFTCIENSSEYTDRIGRKTSRNGNLVLIPFLSAYTLNGMQTPTVVRRYADRDDRKVAVTGPVISWEISAFVRAYALK